MRVKQEPSFVISMEPKESVNISKTIFCLHIQILRCAQNDKPAKC